MFWRAPSNFRFNRNEQHPSRRGVSTSPGLSGLSPSYHSSQLHSCVQHRYHPTTTTNWARGHRFGIIGWSRREAAGTGVEEGNEECVWQRYIADLTHGRWLLPGSAGKPRFQDRPGQEERRSNIQPPRCAHQATWARRGSSKRMITLPAPISCTTRASVDLFPSCSGIRRS